MKESEKSKLYLWPPEAWNPILAEVGRLVFNWNQAEQMFKRLLGASLGIDTSKAEILTAHLPGKVLTDSITTVANEFLNGTQKDHILHCVELFNRITQYRNYYVHSFNGISSNFDGSDPTANFNSITARGRLQSSTLATNEIAIRNTAMVCHQATNYFTLVVLHFSRPELPEYRTLPDKFPLPDKLKSNPRYPLDK